MSIAQGRAASLRPSLVAPLYVLYLCTSACTAESNTAGSPMDSPPEPFSKAESALISRYPSVAPHILHHTPEPLAHPSAFFKLSVELPAFGEDGIQLHIDALNSVIIREESLSGEREQIEQSSAYIREGGYAYWTSTARGVEEWLLFEPGYIYGHQPAATWVLEHAHVRAHGDALEVIPQNQEQGALWVQAPVAYTESGRILKPTLSAPAPDRIELYVDAEGEGVLIDPSWTPTAAMLVPRDNCKTAVLPDGRVLVTGGNVEKNPATLLAEIYDPQSKLWKPGGNMIYPGTAHTATLLPSGSVLIAGGYYIQYTANGADYAFPSNAQLYQPQSNTWKLGPAMLAPRFAHSATLLPNGKVLIAGGISGITNSYLNSAEIYDPSLNLFKAAAPMAQAKASHAALLLPDGKVLVTGGETPGGEPYAGAEIYDPAANAWKAATPMNKVRKDHKMVLLPNGKVLSAGQLPVNGMPPSTIEPGDAEVYDPAINQWAPTALMASPALLPSLTVMGNQKVLLTALDPIQKENTAQVYDPISDQWSEAKPLTWERKNRQAEKLPDGKVLILCGTPSGDPNPIPVAEIYDPGVFYGESCENASECDSGFCVDGVCCNSPCDAGSCDACSAEAGATEDGVCTLLTGPQCDDSNLCTENDRCGAGLCSGTLIVCEPLGPCYGTATCDPQSGACAAAAQENGVSCGTDQSCYEGECLDNSAIPDQPPIHPESGGCNCTFSTLDNQHPIVAALLGLWITLRRRKRPSRR